MVLFDANNKVLGRTSVYGEHALDNEWAYLSRYGYSSVNAVNMMKFHSANSEFYSYDKVNYTLPQNQMIDLSGTTLCLYFNNMICGRINLIAKERLPESGRHAASGEADRGFATSNGAVIAERSCVRHK